ncbi:MAG: hypothetical protein F9K43_08825 [Bauldia sp.]|nr:MAG: hypothetical protein F9K43_08825 [Bauldia sp.]
MADDLFGGEQAEEEADDLFDALRSELAIALAAFADEQDVDDDFLSFLLLDAAVTQRALAYALGTEKPSEGGLKIEFDRFGRAFGELLREAKKQARPMLAHLRQTIAEAEQAADDET